MALKRIQDGARRGPGEYADVEIDWQAISPDVVDNGPVKIFPLARSFGSPEGHEQLAAEGHRLLRAFVHFFGGDDFHAETPLDPETGYGKKLSSTELVARPRYVWSIRGFAFTIVHAVDPDQPAASTLSLHFYPPEWQWPSQPNAHTKQAASRRRTIEKQLQDASIEWRWPDGAAPRERWAHRTGEVGAFSYPKVISREHAKRELPDLDALERTLSVEFPDPPAVQSGL